MDLHVYLHLQPSESVQAALAEILTRLTALQKGESTMAADLTTLQTQVTQNTSVINSAITLINGLAAQLQAAKNDPAAIQAIIDSMKQNDDDLAAAITANTPPPATAA